MVYRMNKIESLRAAIKQGNLNQFKKLISSLDEEEFLSADENGNTLAHLAAIYDQPEILSVLIEKAEESENPFLKSSNNNGFTPLECCYFYSSYKALPLLVADSQLGAIATVVLSKQYDKLAHLSPASFRREKIGKIALFVSALGDTEALEILFRIARDKEEILLYQSKDGWSGVHFAAFNNHLEALQAFPEEHATKVTDDGDTPLMIAASRGNLQIIKYLIQKGGDVHQKNKHHENAVFFAAKNGQMETLHFLQEAGADFLVINDKGENALMLAAQNGHKDSVSLLLDHGVPADLKSKNGNTAFQYALESSQFEIAELLFKKTTTNAKEEALFKAIIKGDIDSVRWLVEHGVSLAATTESQLTPILFAARLGKTQLIEYFLGIEPDLIQATDKDGDNLLFVAIKTQRSLLVMHLIEKGYFSIHDHNSKGKTPLLVAAEMNSETIVTFLHQSGASLEEQDSDGNTALHLLIAQGNYGEAMSYIHAHSPNLIFTKNNKEEIPLHTAIRYKQNYEVKKLLQLVALNPQQKKQLLEARDHEGNTPLLIAVATQNAEAIPLLLGAGADVLAKNNKEQSVLTIAHLNTFPHETLKTFFEAYNLNYKEYLYRRRLYFIFGGQKLNEVLKFPGADVQFGSGLFDEGLAVLNGYLKKFIEEKHPEHAAQFKLLFTALKKLELNTEVESILDQLDRDGMAFQATGFKGHGILATLKNLTDGNMKLLLAERGARVGGAPFLNAENKKFAAIRSLTVPREKREEVIELLNQAKNASQSQGMDILFRQIPELVDDTFQFSSIYQKKFMDICFYSNPKTGLYEQFIEILGEVAGRAFYKEFELYMREKELDKYKAFCESNYPGSDSRHNPIILKAEELIDRRKEVLSPLSFGSHA